MTCRRQRRRRRVSRGVRVHVCAKKRMTCGFVLIAKRTTSSYRSTCVGILPTVDKSPNQKNTRNTFTRLHADQNNTNFPSIIYNHLFRMITPSPQSILDCCHSQQFAHLLASRGPFSSIDRFIDESRHIWWHEVSIHLPLRSHSFLALGRTC